MVHGILGILRPRRNGNPSELVEPQGRGLMKPFALGPVQRSVRVVVSVPPVVASCPPPSSNSAEGTRRDEPDAHRAGRAQRVHFSAQDFRTTKGMSV